MFNWIKNYFIPDNKLGVIPDPRYFTEKEQDYLFSEISSAVPLKWEEKKQYKTFTVRDQNGSSSCCGQASAKALEILFGSVFSAHPIYRSRANFPEQGMYLQNIGDIVKKIGTTLESLDPSQKMSEAELNRELNVETQTKIPAYAFPTLDIDSIAQAIEQNKQCLILVKMSYKEWTNVPTAYSSTLKFSGHCVCAVDYTLLNGEKAIVIEDSWGNVGQRILTESFLKARCYGALTFIIPVVPKLEKPTYHFSRNLQMGNTGEDVVALQKRLQYEGCFDFPVATGYFGSVTRKGVIKLQEKYSNLILYPIGLKQGTGVVAYATMFWLNNH